MTEFIRNDQGKIVAQKVKRADGVEMLVPPPAVFREPAFTLRGSPHETEKIVR